MTTATETTYETMKRRCTMDTYIQENATWFQRANENDKYYSGPYTWDALCTTIKAYQSLQAECESPQQLWHVEARILAVGDWMNRIHDTADGTIAIIDAVAVPDDYPFSRVY